MNRRFSALAVCALTVALTGCNEEGSKGNNDTSQYIKDVQHRIKVTSQNLEEIDVQVSQVQNLAAGDVFQFDDIELVDEGLAWSIYNRTPQTINSLAVRQGEKQQLALLKLFQALPAYSKAKLSSSTHTLSKLNFEEQLKLFAPKVQIAGFDADCSDQSKTCYNAPDDAQRIIYETVLINMRNAFNRKSFSQFADNFFADAANCTKYSGCSSYGDPLLSYSTKNLLTMGMSEHQLGMKVMRNKYAAEGMGGGSSPDINLPVASSGGWASYWESYITPTSANYRPYSVATYNTIFHEVAHAYGFNHDSGMTYGFADAWAKTYVQANLTQAQRENRNVLELPSVLVDSKVIGKGKVRLSYYRPVSKAVSNQVELQIISGQAMGVQIAYNSNQPGSTVDVTFNPIPKAPVYIRSVADNGDYISTLQLKASDMVESPSYTFGGKKYTILEDELLDSEANGWAIRKLCDQSNQELAEKADYQKLWDYMSSNDLLAGLTKGKFLSRDEPSGYLIWMLEFKADQMVSSKYRMVDSLGADKGLVCVEPAI
ncbi:hypothetical protein [Photobacterium sp. J15]|uniref:hypothetical protein n=1 Tax=Photobacterium sp. J15 TaxID=265901 RepID=UPI000A90A881|nr:hypothetical protein [Photobacterium sp. J15]